MEEEKLLLNYPRRRLIRGLLRLGIRLAMPIFTELKVIGRENLPKNGPLLLVGNHFSFLDAVALIKTTPWPFEFIGGVKRPNAPWTVNFFPDWWGILPAYRGSVARGTLLASRQVLDQGGVMVIFPEGGNWADVLRPPRPGAAFVASACKAPIIPVGLDGLTDVFKKFRRGERSRSTIHFGEPFGPLYVSDRGESDRSKLEAIGHEMMRRVARLLPPRKRGIYSDDPALVKEAEEVSAYPWDGNPEG